MHYRRTAFQTLYYCHLTHALGFCLKNLFSTAMTGSTL